MSPWVSVGFLPWLGDSPWCYQSYFQHSNMLSNMLQSLASCFHTSHQFYPYSQDQPECLPTVRFSPKINTCKFTLHLHSQTPRVSQWPHYTLLIYSCLAYYFLSVMLHLLGLTIIARPCFIWFSLQYSQCCYM